MSAEPFDRRRRRIRRDRAASRIESHAFLADHIAAELLDRLAGIRRTFSRALILGASPLLTAALEGQGIATVTLDPGFGLARAAGGVQADEDRLPFADGSFDLIVSAGLLDAVNDLPGALLLCRRVLKPDGVLLAGFAAAGSLPRLRAAMLAGDMIHGGAAPRIHPQVDVRAAGDLLARADFAMPVADGEGLIVRYATLDALLADLRFSGGGGVLADRGPPFNRMQFAAAHAAFLDGADADGRIAETAEIVYLIGWAPAPTQAKAARPGSATASLAAALKPKG